MTPKQAKQRGRKGGRTTSEKKAASSAANGRLSKSGGRPIIQDEFTNLPVSRQRKYQLRQAKLQSIPKPNKGKKK
jgi:hypothetical protein